MSALDELGKKTIHELTRLELCILAMRGYQGGNDVSEQAAAELARLQAVAEAAKEMMEVYDKKDMSALGYHLCKLAAALKDLQ